MRFPNKLGHIISICFSTKLAPRWVVPGFAVVGVFTNNPFVYQIRLARK